MDARRIVTPPLAHEPAPGWHLDGGAWGLLLVNILGIALALRLHWRLESLMLVYWTQSVAIGVANIARIMSLEQFSTADIRMNGKVVDPTPQTRRQVATFFAMHYGFFHVAYFAVLIPTDGTKVLTPAIFLCAAAFALNQVWNYRYHREHDRQGVPNIGTLMFTPYLRIIPMHLTILAAALMDGVGSGGLLLFGVLKTAADVGMHFVERAQVRKLLKASPAAAP